MKCPDCSFEYPSIAKSCPNMLCPGTAQARWDAAVATAVVFTIALDSDDGTRQDDWFDAPHKAMLQSVPPQSPRYEVSGAQLEQWGAYLTAWQRWLRRRARESERRRQPEADRLIESFESMPVIKLLGYVLEHPEMFVGDDSNLDIIRAITVRYEQLRQKPDVARVEIAPEVAPEAAPTSPQNGWRDMQPHGPVDPPTTFREQMGIGPEPLPAGDDIFKAAGEALGQILWGRK